MIIQIGTGELSQQTINKYSISIKETDSTNLNQYIYLLDIDPSNLFPFLKEQGFDQFEAHIKEGYVSILY